jgi:hypothetical protein
MGSLFVECHQHCRGVLEEKLAGVEHVVAQLAVGLLVEAHGSTWVL